MSCVNCKDVTGCILIKSSDNTIVVNPTNNSSGVTYDLGINGSDFKVALSYNEDTHVLTLSDLKGNIISSTTIPPDTLELSGNQLSLKGGNSVPLPIPQLQLNGNTLSLEGGNSVTLAAPTSVSSGSLRVIQGGNNYDVELVPSTDAGNILTLGSDGKPFAQMKSSATCTGNLVSVGSDGGICLTIQTIWNGLLAIVPFMQGIENYLLKDANFLSDMLDAIAADAGLMAKFCAMAGKCTPVVCSSVTGLTVSVVN